ncbi:SpoIIE family protein phosphatase [Streptomyces sp. NPDC008313]|uniref:SpoIIE family protein phosphatase n=1 Tax=Streptomyces sp. NPDC008313 TaxID=3364826 RepID=UPI0036E7C587
MTKHSPSQDDTAGAGSAAGGRRGVHAVRPPSLTRDSRGDGALPGAVGRSGPVVRLRGAGPQDGRPYGARPLLGGLESGRLRYLDVATRRIARGMNLDETLNELVGAAVPAFADQACVFLADPLPVGEETPDAATVLRPHCFEGPGTETCPGPGAPAPPYGAPRAGRAAVPAAVVARLAQLLRTGRPVFADGTTAGTVSEMLTASGVPAAIGPGRRSIVAPLPCRAQPMGCVVLLREARREAFTEDDLIVASQLATHTALGIDKAVLYGREASVADALQRAMLPRSLPEPTGIRLASRYLPASRTAQVGGDWYDAIPLPGNRVALVIGDVMGHSVTSAAIMGQLRTIVQTLAGLDLPPDEVMHHLDEQAERLGSQHMATCLYATYDPVRQRLLVSNAGHPPPLLVRADGTVDVMDIPSGLPIGIGGGAFESTEMPAPPGTTLMLFTDGLIESRGYDLQVGIERLIARLEDFPAGARPGPEALCDRALGSLGRGGRDDDVALLAARMEGLRPEAVSYWYLAPHLQTAGQARRLVRRVLRRWDLEPLVETTELLISEVVANAVRFANQPISLRVVRTDVLRCEVGDDSPQVPRMRHAQLSDEGGRGLWLVDQLADRWGATRVSTGKVVWFEQNLPGRPAPAGDVPH